MGKFVFDRLLIRYFLSPFMSKDHNYLTYEFRTKHSIFFPNLLFVYLFITSRERILLNQFICDFLKYFYNISKIILIIVKYRR